MNISYEQIGHLSVTFPADGCKESAVCKINSTGKAGACSAGDGFIGVVESVNGTQAGVQVAGFAQVSYSGSSTPTPGYVKLSADGSGGVKVDTAGVGYWVVRVDSTAKTLIVKL